MGKKRQILGFLSFCIFCMFALMGGASAVDCGAGTYLDDGVCVSCPPEYPESVAGATSINQCFVHYEGKCEAGTVCPENAKRCTWKTGEAISVDDYYGAPSKKICKINTLTCNSGYYKMGDNQSCSLCADIPGYEGVYVRSSGSGYIEQCYKLCVPMCVRDVCPTHGVCTYVDALSGGGGLYYPTEDTVENCKPLVATSCAMQVECVDTGYTTFNSTNVTCDANTLTIKYDPNGGAGDVVEMTCLYDDACMAADANTFTRQNWEFVEWNTASDGSGHSYTAGDSIMNIISDGEITLYAQWLRLNAKCEAGKYYDGDSQVPCPADSFCTGDGESDAGVAGCATPCPNGGHSAQGASLQSQCYVSCPAPASIKNGTLARVNDKEYNNGTSDTYPACTYHATCNTGYIAQNNNSSAPKCVWENPGDCPVGFYCSDGADEPIACPRIKDDDVSPRGTSNKGARAATDCYYVFAPWDAFKNGAASGKCKYTNDAARYSACVLEQVFSCLPGYYYVTGQTAGCAGVQSGYFSDGTSNKCLADNYTDVECVASLAQKSCPEKTTNATVASSEFATSVTQCSKECVHSDAHGTVTRKSERVNADADGVYAACEYTVVCDTGYMPVDNGTENARCVAREYTITLDKNGGVGNVADSIKCTVDSGVCDLPSSTGLSRTGHSLVPRWCLDAAGTGTCYTAGTRVTTNISSDGTDITLYAIWAPNVYQITLVSNDATVAVAPTAVYLKYGVAWFADSDAQTPISRLATIPVKTGYNFTGFFDTDGAVLVIGDDGAFAMSEQALTFTTQKAMLHANWAAGITECAAGTYYTGTGTTCAPCGKNHYCLGGKFTTDAGPAGKNMCPNGGYTLNDTASSSMDCLQDNVSCVISNGHGIQTCSFNGVDAYNRCDCTTGCTMCTVTECNVGYSKVGNSCIICPADSVCKNGAQNTCSALTGGDYTNSDAGTTDVSQCWRKCPMSANAVAMTGRDYYGGTNNCAASQCKPGYSLQNGACVPCPAGHFCDGTGTGGVNGTLCKTLGDSSWTLSDAGAASASECYKECKQHRVDNGTAIPLAPRAYWDKDCEYRGKSDMGNDCDIVDGVCIETSCISVYEMVNGRCKPCNRENALSYAPDGNCVITSCVIGYHVEGGKCVADKRKCTTTRATAAYQTWDFKMGAYGTCVVEECADGYHVASNACVSDIQVCDIENGIGAMEWNHTVHTWGNCIATSCNAGYTMDPALTNERWKQCGQCKNKFSVRGELAVGKYKHECEIDYCLYQGELYNLENNECVPICDVNGYEDETGTMKWDAEKHKCVRKCKDGYLMWQ